MNLHSISFLGLERVFMEESPKLVSDKEYANYFFGLSF